MSKTIIQHRQKSGNFDCVEQLLDLPKMDQKTVQKVTKAKITHFSRDEFAGVFGVVKIWRRGEKSGGGGQKEETEPDVLARHYSKAGHKIVHRALSLQSHCGWSQHQLE